MNWRCADRAGRPARCAVLAGVLVLLLTAPGRSAGDGTGVEGRLVMGSTPLEGGRVSAFRSAELEGAPEAVSPPSRPDGTYSLDLEPGTYYLAASREDAWSWCGQNPVSVKEGQRPWIGFSLNRWFAPRVSKTTEGGMEGSLTGTVLRDGQPVEDATVSLYFDDSDGFRGMGFLRTPPTGPDGRFRMDMVPSGTYYLIARRRGSGRDVGPMMKGDLISYYRHNPLRIGSGTEVEVVLPVVAKRLEKDIHDLKGEEDRPGFGGVIADRLGNPVGGVHVFAYREPEMGHHKPAALSSISDRKGEYRIYLPGPGRYYVGARDGYGDNPSPGEMFGHYEGSPDHSLTVEASQFLEGVGITVERVLEP